MIILSYFLLNKVNNIIFIHLCKTKKKVLDMYGNKNKLLIFEKLNSAKKVKYCIVKKSKEFVDKIKYLLKNKLNSIVYTLEYQKTNQRIRFS